MDSNIPEVMVGTPAVNGARVCWALKTLVAEVEELFPETPVEYTNHDGRNTALAATFDLSVLDLDENQMLVDLLTMLPHDPRIADVVSDYDTVSVYVCMKSNPRTQDDKSPFGLGDALEVLEEDGTP
jgi:hypothetical protein